jgi:hypothetical protein
MNFSKAFQIITVLLITLSFNLSATTNTNPIIPSETTCIGDKWEVMGLVTLKQSDVKAEKVGRKQMDVGVGEILVSDKSAKYRKVRLEVRNTNLFMGKITLTFTDGSAQDMTVRKKMSANTSTEAFDLNGDKRTVAKITFKFSKDDWKGAPPVVALMGTK